jgi:hypothetical protein
MEPNANEAPNDTPAEALAEPAWKECELFCINNYAGLPTDPCGWRGRIAETRWDVANRVRPCPRCGAATLMELSPVRPAMNE